MGELALFVLYVVPLLIVIWIWLAKSGMSGLRIVLLLLLPLVYLAHWKVTQYREGWPTDDTLPDQFELLSADVVEPNSQEPEGWIHLWVRLKDQPQPRAFAFPYSRELHEMLFKTKKRMEQGIRQQGLVFGREQSGKSASLGSSGHLMFQDMPARVLPPKT